MISTSMPWTREAWRHSCSSSRRGMSRTGLAGDRPCSQGAGSSPECGDEREAHVSTMDAPAGKPRPAEGAKETPTSRRKDTAAGSRAPALAYIPWVALALMTTSSVASLRPSPTMAMYGLACIFLYLLPAVVFLLPTSLLSPDLASGWTGGVYKWVAEGISPKAGFFAVWCQFAMTIFYYPSLLGFVASTLAYVINPDLASNGLWTAA